MFPEFRVRGTLRGVRLRPTVLLAFAGVAVALAALLWPMRAHHATWAVTVGEGQTNYVAMGGGDAVTPIQLIFDGTAPHESVTRAALRGRLRAASVAAGIALAAGAVALQARRPPSSP